MSSFHRTVSCGQPQTTSPGCTVPKSLCTATILQPRKSPVVQLPGWTVARTPNTPGCTSQLGSIDSGKGVGVDAEVVELSEDADSPVSPTVDAVTPLVLTADNHVVPQKPRHRRPDGASRATPCQPAQTPTDSDGGERGGAGDGPVSGDTHRAEHERALYAAQQQENSLYARLRTWRSQTARRYGFAPFNICGDQLLGVLVKRQPTTLPALEELPGANRQFKSTYGKLVTAEIAAFLDAYGNKAIFGGAATSAVSKRGSLSDGQQEKAGWKRARMT